MAEQGEDGQLQMLPSIENTREGWWELWGQLPPGAEIALEVSTSGYFALSVLEEAGWRERAHGVHTAGINRLRKQTPWALAGGELIASPANNSSAERNRANPPRDFHRSHRAHGDG